MIPENHKSKEPLESLHEHKRRIYLWSITAGLLALLVGWIPKALSGTITSYERIIFPVATVLCLGLLIALWQTLRVLTFVELSLFTITGISLLSKLHEILQTPQPNHLAALSDLLYWFPLVYVLAFLIFNSRRQLLIGSLIFFAVSVLMGMIYTIPQWLNGETTDLYLLGRFYLANATYIILLKVGVRLNEQLFANLKRSNMDIGLAYDATIEGWSHALDLRDKETEGHSQRVTEMTVDLARSFGLSEPELIQVRWGSLLHDIGKMGVPDSILLKPGALTEEEWVAMRRHPRFAYDLLSPVRYLRLALDIPYCHHEKWDGTGYPRNLKGEQIPLTARIFAVVDVWDALCSDRPYRAGWPEEKVREHISALSGTHFDPQVVDVFMQSLN